MGIERITITAKVEPENRIWLEGMRQNFWPYRITVSSLVDSILTLVRLKVAMGEITLTPESLQETIRNYRQPGIPEPQLAPMGVKPEMTKAVA